MSSDKKTDDDEPYIQSTARQSIYTHASRHMPHEGLKQEDQAIRRRADRDDTIPPSYYQSARNWRPQRPLIDRVNNAWQDEKQVPIQDELDTIAHLCDPDEDSSCQSVTRKIARSKKWRRLGLVLTVLLLGTVYYWSYYILPQLNHDYDLKVGFLRQPKGTFGLSTSGGFDIGQEKILQLNSTLLPGGEHDPDGKRRLVFVGDIHGCKTELVKLLVRLGFKQGQDHLIATGDIINKGPNTNGVIDELIHLQATSVRGNHEDRILTLADLDTKKFGEPELLSKAAKRDHAVVKQLKPRHIEYLKSLPLILRIPPLPLATSMKGHKRERVTSEILVVHAGLVPAVPLPQQDPYYVMNMRSLTRATHVPSIELPHKHDHTLPWTDSWNWYQQRLSKGRVFLGWHKADIGLDTAELPIGWIDAFLNMFTNLKGGKRPRPQVVVYGHDSRTGYVNRSWSKGLDSSCVRGGQLTALVLDAFGREEIYTVECNAYD